MNVIKRREIKMILFFEKSLKRFKILNLFISLIAKIIINKKKHMGKNAKYLR